MVEEIISTIFNQNIHKKIGIFQFKMQINKNIPKYVVLCNIPRNMQKISKYCHVKGGTRDEMTDSSSDDWIYWHFGYKFFNHT
jgi:hypothetical protein